MGGCLLTESKFGIGIIFSKVGVADSNPVVCSSVVRS